LAIFILIWLIVDVCLSVFWPAPKVGAAGASNSRADSKYDSVLILIVPQFAIVTANQVRNAIPLPPHDSFVNQGTGIATMMPMRHLAILADKEMLSVSEVINQERNRAGSLGHLKENVRLIVLFDYLRSRTLDSHA
jgi:hypothetical protein